MLKRIGILAIGVGVVILIGALALGIILPWAWGHDVIMISPHAPDVVELNRISWTKGENVVDRAAILFIRLSGLVLFSSGKELPQALAAEMVIAMGKDPKIVHEGTRVILLAPQAHLGKTCVFVFDDEADADPFLRMMKITR